MYKRLIWGKRLNISKPNIQYKKLSREQLNKLKESMKKETQKITAEIHEMENNHNIDVTNGANFWFFEKTHKTDRPLARLSGNREVEPYTVERKRDFRWRINLKHRKGIYYMNSFFFSQ